MTLKNLHIEKTVEQLLQHYECVILPGLGGFIVRDSPSNLNADKTLVKPFARHIFFNPHLLQNDGLLVNEIQKQNGIAYNEALDQCNQAVDSLKSEIETSGSKSFGSLGTFYKGQQNIWFAPSSSLNLALESYGLIPVEVHSIKNKEEVSIEPEPIKTIPIHADIMEADNKDIEATEPRKRGLKPWLIAASLALLVHFAYLNLEPKSKTENQASVLPEITLSDSEQQPLSSDISIGSSANIVNIDTLASTVVVAEAEAPITENIVSSPVPAEVIPSTKTDTAVIHEEIVNHSDSNTAVETRVARYLIESNAEFHVKDLLKKGQHAKVVRKEEWFEVILVQDNN